MPESCTVLTVNADDHPMMRHVHEHRATDRGHPIPATRYSDYRRGFHAETWQPGDTSRHSLDAKVSAAPSGSLDSQQTATSDDPRRQGRNVHQPEATPGRRNRGLNSEWLSFINALTGAERNQ